MQNLLLNEEQAKEVSDFLLLGSSLSVDVGKQWLQSSVTQMYRSLLHRNELITSMLTVDGGHRVTEGWQWALRQDHDDF